MQRFIVTLFTRTNLSQRYKRLELFAPTLQPRYIAAISCSHVTINRCNMLTVIYRYDLSQRVNGALVSVVALGILDH